MAYNPKRGATLVELVMVIVLIGWLAVSGAYLLSFFVKNSVALPNQLNTDMAAGDALNIMIDGDSQAKGLRFSRQITAVQGNSVTFVNQDGQTIVYTLNTSTKKLYRSINGGAQAAIPYYAATGFNMTAATGSLFAYLDANNAVTSTPANVRLVRMDLTAATGTGSYSDWEGQSRQSSAVKVHKMQ